jgi:hypothetical protein
MVDSVPPATITSTSPYSIIRPASPIEWVPVVQADTTANDGPFRPSMIDSWPDTMLMMEPGTKKGEMRRGPRLTKSLWLSSIIGRPPMPELTTTPIRSALLSSTCRPESRNA